MGARLYYRAESMRLGRYTNPTTVEAHLSRSCVEALNEASFRAAWQTSSRCR